MYTLFYNLNKNRIFESAWIRTLKQILLKCNVYDLWNAQELHIQQGINNFKRECKKNLLIFFEDNWK